MANKIILMANDKPGALVSDYLINSGDKIVRLYLHDENARKCSDEIIRNSSCSEIYYAKDLKEENHVKTIKELYGKEYENKDGDTKKYGWGDFAILSRKRNDGRNFVDALKTFDIPSTYSISLILASGQPLTSAWILTAFLELTLIIFPFEVIY